MAKPAGSRCNHRCRYCFYREKERLHPPGHAAGMSEEVLETFIRQYIEARGGEEVHFLWQGGEPTILGLDFFRRVVQLQAKHARGRQVVNNAIQTNGSLLDDEWCRFLAENQFLVGLSIDGPEDLHNLHRVDARGRPTFKKVMQGLERLKAHGVEVNALAVIHAANARHPLRVYRFLRRAGFSFLQFIPVVERFPGERAAALGLDLGLPPGPRGGVVDPRVTAWSVEPERYGQFMVKIFDHWVKQDVGRCFVRLFDVALAAWMGLPPSLCVFAERCGDSMVLEHNGDLYCCDHYVYPQYRLGNIVDQPLKELSRSAVQREFRQHKQASLPQQCIQCDVLFACNGGCPKHRFATTRAGEPGLNYLCQAYQTFFRHVDPQMKAMARLLRSGQPPALIMESLSEPQRSRRAKGRNEQCPCGSGLKYKRCCGGRS